MLRLEDLSPGMELKGTVVNVVPFGAFVDIGLKDTGLVHISRMANKFIKNPYEVVGVGDVVPVWVVEVDNDRKRASLTMVAPGQERKPPAASRVRCASSASAAPGASRTFRSPGAAAARPTRRPAAATAARSRRAIPTPTATRRTESAGRTTAGATTSAAKETRETEAPAEIVDRCARRQVAAWFVRGARGVLQDEGRAGDPAAFAATTTAR